MTVPTIPPYLLGLKITVQERNDFDEILNNSDFTKLYGLVKELGPTTLWKIVKREFETHRRKHVIQRLTARALTLEKAVKREQNRRALGA